MKASRLLLAALGVAVLPLGAASQDQEANPAIYVDELKPSFLEKLDTCVEAGDWKSLFSHYDFARTRYAQKVVALDGSIGNGQWTSVAEYLIRRFSGLPKAAYEFYRFENDGHAARAFEKAREEKDEPALQKAAVDYFFATGTDRVLDELGSRALDDGRAETAVYYWDRLLRYYPDSDLPKEVLAARIAHACRIAENAAALRDLREFVIREKIDGTVRIRGRERRLQEYLSELTIPDRVASPRPLKLPYALGFEDRYRRGVRGVRNEIKRWTYDFTQDAGQPVQSKAPTAPQPRAQLVLARAARSRQPSTDEYPLFPAYTRLDGKDYVIASDGSRVVTVDPARVSGASTLRGVYWKYPEASRILPASPNSNPRSYSGADRPYIGAAVDGRRAYVTMYSRNRPSTAPNPRNVDFFQGVTSVKCFDIPTGRRVWDTDEEELLAACKTAFKDFHDRNFSFSGRPIVREGRIYLGVCTSPAGERESWVVCLDQATGRPLWATFLCSDPRVRTRWGWTTGRQIVYQTLLAEQGGIVYAHTNLGVVAAVNGVTGDVLWLSSYERAVKVSRFNRGVSNWIRPANWPRIWKGTLFVLPQDAKELLGFEKVSGRRLDLPEVKWRFGEFSWPAMSHLVDIAHDWMVLGGNQSHVLRLKDFQAYNLAASVTTRFGHGVVHGGLVYLPQQFPDKNVHPYGVLGVYDASPSPGSRNQPTWKNLAQVGWKSNREGGNLLIAGDYLIVATDKLMVYTDVETIRDGFVRRLYQSPPHTEALLQFGDTMLENGRLEEAAEAFLAFVRSAEGDASMKPRVAQVKRQLHSIFMKRGEEAEEEDLAKALEFYRFSKDFAYDRKSEAESTERLAETFKKLERWKEAVAQYQELIEKARGLYHREADSVGRLWEHARRSIDGIVSKVPDAYADVEKKAAEALKEAQKTGGDALKGVMDRFPNSKTAREAWRKLADSLFKEGRFDALKSLFEEFEDRFKNDLEFDGYRKILEFLKKLGDAPRLRRRLADFGERFAGESVPVGDRRVPVAEFVAAELRELGPAPPSPALSGPLRKVGEMHAEEGAASSDPHGLPGRVRPLRPLGIAPPGFGPDLELFERGSSVELWDLKERRLIWARFHPGAYLGVLFEALPGAEPGLKIAGVKPESPAAKAGFKQGDVLLRMDGRAVSADTFSDALAEIEPGRSVRIEARRDGAPLRARVETSAHPWRMRPSIVGASFTRDYALAVAWEDQVASVDLATGAVRWTFRDLRDRFGVGTFHATDGRLYVYESPRLPGGREPFRAYTAGEQEARREFEGADSHTRLLCLSDHTGDVVWGKAFDATLGAGRAKTQLTFFGDYLSDQVLFLQMLPRSNSQVWTLWQLAARDGALIDGGVGQRVLLGRVLAHAIDPKGGVFYYACDPNGRGNERYLKSLPLTPEARKRKRVDIAIHSNKYMPRNYPHCMLEANERYVCLIVPPYQAGAGYRVWVFEADGGREFRSLSLLKDRTLPMNRAAGSVLDDDGTLYLYNVPRSEGLSQRPRRAYLTAFRIGADIENLVAWDAVAPVLRNHAGVGWSLSSPPGRYAIFTATKAAVPGQAEEEALALLYDKSAEGYISLVHSGLDVEPGAARPPVTAWRGRLYINSGQGLQIYGE